MFYKYFEYLENKICDFVDVWYRRFFWDTYEDLTSYINSSTFIGTAVLMFLIPLSELWYFNTVYYFYIAIVALLLDIILFYLLIIIIEADRIPGFGSTAVRIPSFVFYFFMMYEPSYLYEVIVSIVFPGSGDFILSQDLFLGKISADSALYADKKEIMFRIFWGLGHAVIIYIFSLGFSHHWRRANAVRDANPEFSADLDQSYDRIFKKSLLAGIVALFNSIEKFPAFWGFPIFLFMIMADFSGFAKSPFLLYTALSGLDAIRILSYNFIYFETAFWGALVFGILTYLGNFDGFSNFYDTIKMWIRSPLSGYNFVKLAVVAFFLCFLPLFWLVTDNGSFNAFVALTALEYNQTIIWFSATLVLFFFGFAVFAFTKSDCEELFVKNVFYCVCATALFFLALTLNFHNNFLNDVDRALFYVFDLCNFFNLGSNELLMFGYDYIALLLCLMSSIIFALVMYFSLFAEVRYKVYYFACLLYLLFFILICFLSLNLFTFYLAFESTIIPIGLLIFQWGSSEKRYFASRQYVFYSVVSGLPLLAGLGYLYHVLGSLDYLFILNNLFMLSHSEQLYLWFSFFLVFAVKIPLFPFHSWLLNAHVEASTGVSIILAAVLLKIGSFGIIRYLLGLFHVISVECADFVHFLALFGVMYASICAISEIDLKRLVAFTSIAHMNFAVLGLFMFEEPSFYGAVITMYAHSVVSAALFFIVGVLYSRVHIREITVYGGLVQLTPILSFFLFFFAIANAGFPCSLSFIGELFLFVTFFKKLGIVFIFLLCFSTILLLYANLRFFIYVCFGTINTNYISPAISDFGHIELCVCLVLTLNAFVLFAGFDHFFYPLFNDFLPRYFIK